ncbi:MAG: winged helix-turn-helix domain-containing protein [Blastocatellia bacterium]
MHELEDKRYLFGPFRLDTRLRRLYQGDEQIPLRPKTYEILQFLVERAGVVIEKEQMLETIWPNQIVEETNLTQHIYRLRKLLGDSQKSPEYIVTILGKGHLFNQKVSLSEGLQSDDSPERAIPINSRGDGRGDVTWRVASGRRIHPLLLWGLVLLPLTVLGATLALYWSGKTVFSTAKELSLSSLVTFPGEESDLSFSPDGRYIVFTSEGETQDNQDIYVKAVDTGEVWRVTTHPEKDTQAVWSPDGTRLAFLRSSGHFGRPYKLMIAPMNGGGEEQEIGEVSGGLSWSPDGKYLAASANERLGQPTSHYLFSLDGRERHLLLTPPPQVYDTLQQFSPDGKRLAFVRWRNTGNADLFLYTLANQTLTQLTHDENLISDFEWAPNNAEIYFISSRKGGNRLWRLPVGGGEPLVITSVPPHIKSFTLSPQEDRLAFTQPINDTQIDLFERTGQGGASLRRRCRINSSRADDHPRFSPDGSRMVFVSGRTGFDEIWIANSDCSNVNQLTTFRQVGVGSPRWSPDGEWLVFDRNSKDNTDIFKIRVDGTDLRQLTSDPAVENMPSWSRDGAWIYFSSFKTSIPRVDRVPASGGEVVPVTLSQGQEAIESEDGTSLYFTNGTQLWRKDLQRGDEAPIPELASVPFGRYWDISGTTLFYLPQESGERPLVRTFDLARRTSGQLFELPGSLAAWVPGINVAPGGSLIAVAYVANRHGDISLLKGWK